MTPLYLIMQDQSGRIFKVEISQDNYLELTITHSPGYSFGQYDPPHAWTREPDDDETSLNIRCTNITITQVADARTIPYHENS